MGDLASHDDDYYQTYIHTYSPLPRLPHTIHTPRTLKDVGWAQLQVETAANFGAEGMLWNLLTHGVNLQVRMYACMCVMLIVAYVYHALILMDENLAYIYIYIYTRTYETN